MIPVAFFCLVTVCFTGFGEGINFNFAINMMLLQHQNAECT